MRIAPSATITMPSPTPVQSFLGGVGLAPPVYLLMRLNGAAFGVSGFLHRAVRGNTEALSAVLGLVAGGVVIGLLESGKPPPTMVDLPRTLISGLLVGLGTKVRIQRCDLSVLISEKLSNGCTSG